MIKPHRNPYIIGRPIDDREFFVGRESLFDFIDLNLGRGEQVILLHGQRRIGKSSIIRNIPKFVDRDGFVFVPFDLEYHTEAPLSRILAALAQEILEHLELSAEQIRAPEIQELESDPYIFYSKFLPQVYQELNGDNLVLLLDEFDALNTNDSESLVENFFTFLSSIIEVDNKLFIISFLGRKSANMPNLLRIFKQAPSKEIGLLDDDSANTLIIKPSEGVLEYKPDAIQAILKLSAGHPYFTQVICFAIFGRAREQEKWKVSFEDVEAIVYKAIELAEAGLAWFWDGLSISEKVVFSAAAEAQKIAIKEVKNKLQEPLKLLENSGIKLNDELHEAEKKLVQTGLLDEKERKVKIEFVGRWLVQRHPLKQVTQEINELEKIEQKKSDGIYELKTQFSHYISIKNSNINNHTPNIYGDVLSLNSHSLPNFIAENTMYLSPPRSEIIQRKKINFALIIAQIIKSKPKSFFAGAIGCLATIYTIVGVSVYGLSTPCSASEKKVLGILCVADPSINISRGDHTFFLTTPNTNRDLGIEAFKKGNYTVATQLFKKALDDNPKDPEVLIYYNNALARQKGSPITLAVVVPIDNAEGKAQEMLSGVAQAQNQFNNKNGLKGQLLEIAIANDGELKKAQQPEKAKQIAQELIQDKSVLGVIGHNSSEATQATLTEYDSANPKLAVISPPSSSTDLNFSAIPSVQSKKFAVSAQKQWKGHVSGRTVTSYDATQAFLKAIQAASTNLSRETVLQALQKVNISPNETSEDPIQLNDKERQNEPVLVQVKDGKFTILPSSIKPPVTPVKSIKPPVTPVKSP